MVQTQTTRTRQYGLTLVEMVVSISIVAVISGVLLVGAASARRGATVRSGALQVAGFLRETAALAINGVKEGSCGTAVSCSQYKVGYVAGGDAYTREAVGGGAVATRRLPAGALFADSGTVTFRLTPPVLSVETASGTLSPGSKLPIPMGHASGEAAARNVCVDGNGGVAVTAGVC